LLTNPRNAGLSNLRINGLLCDFAYRVINRKSNHHGKRPMVRDYHDAIERAGSAVLDVQHLDKYTAGDAVLRRELLSLFTDQLAQQVAALCAGCAGDDWMIATHTLKGAARAVGAFQIGETAEALEQLDPDADAEACAKLIDVLVQQTHECKAAIEKISQAA